MGVAALGLLAAGAFYLRPTLTALSTAPARAAPSIEPTIGSVSFGDAQHGAVQILGMSSSRYRTYITENGGRTWKPVSEPMSPLRTAVFLDRRTLLVQEIRPNARPSLRTTQDGGRTWRTLNDPGSGDTAAGGVFPVGPGPTFMDAQNGWWVEHSSPDRGPPAAVGLWRTSDGGVTWQRLRAAGMQRTGYLLDPVFVDPMHGAFSLGMPPPARSILTTSDGGDTWRVIELPDLALMGTEVTRTIVLKHGRRLLASLLAFPTRAMTDRFIIGEPRVVDMSLFVSVSDDGGQTWNQPRAGPNLVGPYVGAAIPQLDDRGRLLLLDGRRLWISEDDGVTWTAVVVQAPAGLSPNAVVAAVPGALYAAAIAPIATYTVGASFRRTLIRSRDGGAHWSAVNLPRPNPDVAG